ncbi:Protein of unknown function [Gryllus bimaculatus]|nr:Protein of unknown function [Gryllus bimaculatus]
MFAVCEIRLAACALAHRRLAMSRRRGAARQWAMAYGGMLLNQESILNCLILQKHAAVAVAWRARRAVEVAARRCAAVGGRGVRRGAVRRRRGGARRCGYGGGGRGGGSEARGGPRVVGRRHRRDGTAECMIT